MRQITQSAICCVFQHFDGQKLQKDADAVLLYYILQRSNTLLNLKTCPIYKYAYNLLKHSNHQNSSVTQWLALPLSST